jgi:dihydroorotate dehydrogenase (fumarate)
MESTLILSSTISGFKVHSCLMNASGVHCTEDNELKTLIHSDAGALVTKSCTLEKRIGNPLPRYASIPHGSINSMGLPNNGVDYYLNFITEHQSSTSKPIILSVAGLSHKENIALLEKANQCEALNIIELNLSCPNIPGKPQTGYDFEASKALLDEAFAICKKPIAVKLPPYFDMVHFEEMANVLKGFPIAYVCCVNSIGNGLWIDSATESVVIKPKSGFGGIGGLFIKPTALANVRMFYTLLPGVDIVGCGGVTTGQDAFEHILCGASMVQIATTLWEEGASCIDRIGDELANIMAAKGYNSINDFKGKLKEIN